MSFDFVKFCHDHDVPTAPEGHKHSTEGWINVPCPFCTGDPGWHLGFCIDQDHFHCWRCGFHTAFDTVHALLNCSTAEAATIISQYKGRPVLRSEAVRAEKKLKDIKWPLGSSPLGEAHKTYLRNRNFNPLDLEEQWGLRGTGPVGPYKFRVIAPIYFKGVFVSYQGRDITNKSNLPYKACREQDESRPHQDCLYGLDRVVGGSVVIVEGIVDVWRLGYGAVGTFGIDFTKKQIMFLAQIPKRFLLYDNEPLAQSKARELAACLSAFGGETYILNLDVGDPAEMTQGAADKLMKGITGRKVAMTKEHIEKDTTLFVSLTCPTCGKPLFLAIKDPDKDHAGNGGLWLSCCQDTMCPMIRHDNDLMKMFKKLEQLKQEESQK